MIKKRGKKGQFYLLAAAIIIGILISFVTITNYSKKKSSLRLYDFGEELGIESKNVLDYGTYNEFNELDMDNLLKNFTESYVEYGEGGNLYFIFGNQDKLTIIGYQELASEEVSVDVGSGSSSLVISEDTYTLEEFYPSGNKVVITINGAEYEFKLRHGENFYFVISQEIGGEQYVVTN